MNEFISKLYYFASGPDFLKGGWRYPLDRSLSGG